MAFFFENDITRGLDHGAKMLHSFGLYIEPGMIVLTGGITEAIHVFSRDFIEVEFDELDKMDLTVI